MPSDVKFWEQRGADETTPPTHYHKAHRRRRDHPTIAAEPRYPGLIGD